MPIGETSQHKNGQRVLALVTDAFGGYGGIAQYNRDFLRALCESPQIQEVVVLPRIGSAADGDMPDKVYQLKPSSSRLSYSAKALQQAFVRGSFDIIFCGHLYLAPLARMLAKRSDAKLWIQIHGVEAWPEAGPWIRRALEEGRLVTSVSRYTRQRFLEWADMAPDRVKVLPNTVRSFFNKDMTAEADPETVLRRFDLEGREVVLTVARINVADAKKGHDKVISAMAAVRRRYPDAVYTVVGDGNNRTGLERLAAVAGESEGVRFLGRLSDEETRALYHAARVFVMPSTKEGFGIVFLEAAACGLPVIAGNRDGSVDALAEGELGILIDPDDHDALVTAICDVLEKRRSGTPSDALDRFDVRNFKAQVDALVRSLH